MKKTIILILIISLAFLFKSNYAAAQNWPAPGSYTVNNTMQPFHGTWRWVSGIDTVKIYLTTQKVYYNIIEVGFYLDNIVGWHIYKRGNQVIESSFAYKATPYSNGFSTIFGGNNNMVNILQCQLKDLSKNKSGELTLTLNAAQNQLTWRSTEHQGMRVYGPNDVVPPAGLTLPRNMVLTKQ